MRCPEKRAMRLVGPAKYATAMALIELHPDGLDHLLAGLGLRLDERAELLRAPADGRLDADRQQLLTHFRVRHHLAERSVEPRDDLLGRAGRRDHALPDAEVEAGQRLTDPP